jgi:hypothetical protein
MLINFKEICNGLTYSSNAILKYKINIILKLKLKYMKIKKFHKSIYNFIVNQSIDHIQSKKTIVNNAINHNNNSKYLLKIYQNCIRTMFIVITMCEPICGIYCSLVDAKGNQFYSFVNYYKIINVICDVYERKLFLGTIS